MSAGYREVWAERFPGGLAPYLRELHAPAPPRPQPEPVAEDVTEPGCRAGVHRPSRRGYQAGCRCPDAVAAHDQYRRAQRAAAAARYRRSIHAARQRARNSHPASPPPGGGDATVTP